MNRIRHRGFFRAHLHTMFERPFADPGFFFGRFRKNSLKKNSPISKNSLIFAETHGKKDPETEISANFSYLTMIPAIINLRKNEFSLVLLTITT